MVDHSQRDAAAYEPHSTPYEDIAAESEKGAIAEAIAEIRLLLAEAKGLIEAERAYFKTRVDFTKKQVVKLLVMGILAAVCALLLAIAVVVGAILTLATLVGPGFATIIVACPLIIITALLGFGCKRAAKDIKLGQ